MMGLFGAGGGKFYLNGLRCKGNETSITQCPMRIEKVGESNDGDDFRVGLRFGGRGIWYRNYHRSTCWMHEDDAAVQCYDTGLNLVSSMYGYQCLIRICHCHARNQVDLSHKQYCNIFSCPSQEPTHINIYKHTWYQHCTSCKTRIQAYRQFFQFQSAVAFEIFLFLFISASSCSVEVLSSVQEKTYMFVLVQQLVRSLGRIRHSQLQNVFVVESSCFQV